MKTLTTIYHLLNIRHKLGDETLRLVYLKEVWGCDQKTIAEMEGISQPLVSRKLNVAKGKYTKHTIEALSLSFTVEELKYIQSLPRDVLPDIQLIAFVYDILKLEISHPFYSSFITGNDNMRIAGLYQLGIMNKHLVKTFNKTQAGVSMIVKRVGTKAADIERPLRYDLDSSVFDIRPRTQPVKPVGLTLAGGQNI